MTKGLRMITMTFFTAFAVYSTFMTFDIPFAYSATLSDKTTNLGTETTKPSVKPTTPATEVPGKPGEAPLPIPAPKADTVVIVTAMETDMTLKVFDKEIDLTGMPIIASKDGKTVLPLRKLGEAMGYTVKWDDTIKGALLQKGTETITVKIDSLEYSWGSTPRKFSKKIEMYKNRLYVPVDFITSNPALQLTQGDDSIVVALADKEAKSALTGVIQEITLFSNGLGLKVLEKTTETMLYVSKETNITDYSTGEIIDSSKLKVGTKAIFSYSVVTGDGKKDYNLLKTVEVVNEVEQKKKP